MRCERCGEEVALHYYENRVKEFKHNGEITEYYHIRSNNFFCTKNPNAITPILNGMGDLMLSKVSKQQIIKAILDKV